MNRTAFSYPTNANSPPHTQNYPQTKMAARKSGEVPGTQIVVLQNTLILPGPSFAHIINRMRIISLAQDRSFCINEQEVIM